MTFVIAINYGSRNEITRAVRSLAKDAVAGKVQPEGITEATVASYLDTADMPDPDLMIRTSGEQRLSNYLLCSLPMRSSTLQMFTGRISIKKNC